MQLSNPLRGRLVKIVAVFLLVVCSPAVLAETTAIKDAQLIRERYATYLTGDDKTFTGPYGEAALAHFIKDIERTLKFVRRFDFDEDRDKTFRLMMDSPGKGYQSEAKIYGRFIQTYLPNLAFGYNVGGDKNPHYRKQEILDLYVQCLDYLHARGVRDGVTFHYNQSRMQMKGAPQPGPGVANLVKMELRMGSLCQSFLLMQPHIKDETVKIRTRKLVRHLEMLGRTSGHVRYYEPRENPEKFKHLVQSDAIQIYSDTTLVSALLEDEPTRQKQLLQEASLVYTDSLKVIPGWADTIKPDFTGFHHRGVYGNAYTGGFIPQAAFGVYLLHGTKFAVAPESVRNLHQLILTYRLYCQKFAMPFGIRGRMPLSTDHLKNSVFAGILTLGSDLGLGDAQMKRVFARLWHPQEVGWEFLYSGGRGKPFRGFYTLNMLDQLLTENPEAEPDPQGFWYKPYAGLGIHRRGAWMATVRGYSRYLWDYERGKPGDGENSYGDYFSHGSLTIFAKGEPVNDIASGYDLRHGWDWFRMLGTTAVHFRIKPDRSARHRSANGSAFLGGASADDHNGVQALIIDQSHSNDGVEINLKARKSYFFADDLIVLLGSGISGGDGTHAVETTLFQNVIPENTDYKLTEPSADAAGNGYHVPDGQSLKFKRGMQKSIDHNGAEKTEGDVVVSWFDHGLSPKDAGYEAAVWVQGADRIQQLQAKPEEFYQVLERSKARHSVYFPRQNTVMHSIFDAGAVSGKWLTSVSRPCVAALKMEGGKLNLSLAAADLGLIPDGVEIGEDLLKDVPRKNLLYSEPKTFTTTIKLKGRWETEAEGVEPMVDKEGTSITLKVTGGKPARLIVVSKD
ncbi:hypothetical protein NT6N_09980 [Oceaniferula spumae]|uniref:Chondroitinase n=1 Tax=Oceaniferula spumae TaxID=2979115 RepID=A0AAT9FJ13_9BACT